MRSQWVTNLYAPHPSLRVGGWLQRPRSLVSCLPSPRRGKIWELAAQVQKMAAKTTQSHLKDSSMAVNGHAVYLPTPLDWGHEGKPAADESHLSGFLESGHTRNSSKAWSKARGGFSVLSLLSADCRELHACRHLRATADGGARVPRSADASRAHTPLSMVWQLRPSFCTSSATRAALIDTGESTPTGLAPPPGALETLSPTGGDERFGSEAATAFSHDTAW